MRFLFQPRFFALLLVATWVSATSAQDQASTSADDISEVVIFTQEWEGDTNADMTGIYWETLRAVFEPIGIELKVTFMPYNVSIIRVKAAECDMALSSYMNEYPELLYPDWPQEIEEVYALHGKSTRYRDQNSFVGKKSAWINDYHYEQFLPAGIDFTEVRSVALGLRMLERDRIDFFLDYDESIRSAAEETGVDLTGFVFSRVTKLAKRVYPMFRNNDRGRALVEIYDRRMAVLHKDGTLDRIFCPVQQGQLSHSNSQLGLAVMRTARQAD